MTRACNLLGKKFGRLTVIKRAENDKKGNTRWLCKCDCGKYNTVKATHLNKGKIKSCGCIKKEMMSKRENAHHKSNTKLYYIWAKIKQRCLNSKDKDYKRYKGRGITICDEWKNNFMSFYKWAINNGYREGLTIDRMNNDGNYEPNNCRWTNRTQQANNTSRNKIILWKGEKHTIAEWARKIGIKGSILGRRILKGMPLEKCFYLGKLSNNGVDYL